MSIKSIVRAIIRPVVRALPDSWFGEGSDIPPRPGAKSLVVTKYAPTPLNGSMGDVAPAQLVVTGYPVRLALIIGSVGLAVSGHAPALSAHPAPASMVVTGYAPTPVAVPNAAEPAAASLVVRGHAPFFSMGVPAPASMVVRAYSPLVLIPAPIPTTAALAVTGHAPTLSAVPAPASMVVTGHAPTLSVTPPAAALAVTGRAPTLSVMPAAASMVVTGYAPTLAAAGPVLTYINTYVDETSSVTRTFSSVPIGTASADRLVVVAVGTGGGSSTPTAVSIGGTNGTIHAQGSASGWQTATIASRVVSSGTTADIVVTRAASGGPTAIAVYTITGLASTTPEGADFSSGDPISLILAVPEGAVMVACAHGGDADSAYTVTGATVDSFGTDSFNNYWFGSETGMAFNATYEITFSRSNPWSAAAAVTWL